MRKHRLAFQWCLEMPLYSHLEINLLALRNGGSEDPSCNFKHHCHLRSEHEGSKRMKTELLVQMDGLARSDDLVFLLAASNLPW